MSTQKSVLPGAVLLFCALFFFSATGEAEEGFARNLGLGDSGKDVLELQIFLNEHDATKVADVGPGSPGNETDYYGTLTADAVRRYQELYRKAILLPSGLAAGTGFFGPSTRRFANAERTDGHEQTGTQAYPTVFPSLDPDEFIVADEDPDAEVKELFREIIAGVNPRTFTQEQFDAARLDSRVIPATDVTPTTTRAVLNLVGEQNEKNVDWFIEFLEEGGYLDDMDEETRELVKEKIRENSEKDIDELIQESGPGQDGVSWNLPPLPANDVPEFLRPLAYLLLPHEAQAAWVPVFGGLIYYRFYCWGSGTWAIVIGLPMPAWLGYTYTQQYAYWQFPFSVWAKGWYVPGTQTCYIWVGYVYTLVPTMGVITNMVGTSMP